MYLAIIIWVVDLFYEVDGWESPRKTIIIAIIGLVVLCGFTFGYVYIRLPLSFLVKGTNAEYPPSTTMGGIRWSPKFYDLRIIIDNETAHDYEDIDLTFKPDVPVVRVGQIEGLCHFVFEDAQQVALQMEDHDPAGGISAVPLVLIASESGYRARCDKLPAQSMVEIVIATAVVKWSPKPTGLSGIYKPDYVMRVDPTIPGSSNNAHWFAHPMDDENTNMLYGPRVAPKTIQISGHYTVLQRKKDVSEHFPILELGVSLH